METVTIPEFMKPFECTINNVHYGPYAPGTTVEVPAEVAALIRNNAALEPRENPPETLEEEIRRIATEIAEAKVAEAVADVTEKYVIDLSSVPFTPGEPVDLAEAGIIDKATYLNVVASARDIWLKVASGEAAGYWAIDNRATDGHAISTTKMVSSDGTGIVIANVGVAIGDAADNSVYGEVNFGFAANPYAGGGE